MRMVKVNVCRYGGVQNCPKIINSNNQYKLLHVILNAYTVKQQQPHVIWNTVSDISKCAMRNIRGEQYTHTPLLWNI